MNSGLDEQAIKKLFQDQTEEVKRHQQMMLEEFQSRVKIIAEVQTEHTKKFERIFQMLGTLMEMTAMNTEQIEMIKGMLKRKVDLDEYEKLEKRVALLEKKLHLSV